MAATPLSHFLSGRRLALLIVAMAGTALAIWSFRDARTRDRERIESEFVRRTAIRHALTREVLGRYEDALFGLSTLFMIERDVSRSQFRRAAMRLAERIPGALALQWVPLVAGADRAKVEASLQQSYHRPEIEFTEVGPEGRPQRAGDRESYLPIAYIEPLAVAKQFWDWTCRSVEPETRCSSPGTPIASRSHPKWGWCKSPTAGTA